MVHSDSAEADWSKLDDVYANLMNTVVYGRSMTDICAFAVDPSSDSSMTATQKQRQQRRRPEEAIEKRPQMFRRADDSEGKGQNSKLKAITLQIKDVILFFMFCAGQKR